MEKVIVSNSIRELEDYAFYRCQKLREVVFESGSHLERIGEACFAGCGIESMCLPRSLRDIDIQAFDGCQSLSQLGFERMSKLRSVGRAAFRGTQLSPAKVKYPKSLKAVDHGFEW